MLVLFSQVTTTGPGISALTNLTISNVPIDNSPAKDSMMAQLRIVLKNIAEG